MMMPLLNIVVLLVSIGIPVGVAWRIASRDEASRKTWLLKTIDGLLFATFIILVARWDVAGLYTRMVVLALLVGAVLLSWRRHAGRQWQGETSGAAAMATWPSIGATILFGASILYVVSGMVSWSRPHELAFPLQGGHFIVGQGGGNPLLNHHSGHRAQHHAVDILALGPLGFRSAGLHPRNLDRYAIWGARVVSPCDAVVTAVRDGLPDLIPPRSDKENASGNHVVLACNGLSVELAHLQKGSVLVKAGDRLATGAPIGAVGNSGNTSEPHLHVHAVDPNSGEGVAVAFDGQVPVRNGTYWSPARS